MAWRLEFKPPLVRPIRRGTAPFEQAGGGAVGFEVGAVDHQSVRRARQAREPCEDAVEDAARDATIIDAGNAAGKWEEGLDSFHLGGRE